MPTWNLPRAFTRVPCRPAPRSTDRSESNRPVEGKRQQDRRRRSPVRRAAGRRRGSPSQGWPKGHRAKSPNGMQHNLMLYALVYHATRPCQELFFPVLTFSLYPVTIFRDMTSRIPGFRNLPGSVPLRLQRAPVGRRSQDGTAPESASQSGPLGITNRQRPALRSAHSAPMARFSTESSFVQSLARLYSTTR